MCEEEPQGLPPVTIIAAAGNTVLITDEWLDEGGSLGEATVVDKVTDEHYRFVLVDLGDVAPEFHWLRRLNEHHYVDTHLYAPMDYVPADGDEYLEELSETIENAEMELVMAIGIFPRYDLDAEWMDESRRRYLDQMQSGADDVSPEHLDSVRRQLLGVSRFL